MVQDPIGKKYPRYKASGAPVEWTPYKWPYGERLGDLGKEFWDHLEELRRNRIDWREFYYPKDGELE